MAWRRKKDEDETEFVINAREPSLGVGIRVRGNFETETYKFVRGGERTFKAAYCKLYIKPAYNVSPETRLLLKPPPPPPPAPVKPVVVVAQHTDTKLEKAIAANPDSDAPYRAYAAWLTGQGDPRGELIRVQCDRARSPKDRKLAAAEAKLFEAHGAYLMPPLLAQAIERTKRSKTAQCSVEWHCGYLKSVRLAREVAKRLADIDFTAITTELVDHPAATFLRSLVIADSIAFATVRTIGRRKLPTLEVLDIAADHGDFGSLFAAPRLQRLVLRGYGLKVKKQLSHDTLRELVIDTANASALDLDGLLTGYFPALEQFELKSNTLELSPEQVTHLRLDDFAPKLTRLALRGIGGSLTLVEALAKSEMLPRLTSLVIEAIDLDDKTHKVVRDHRAEFSHFTELVLERLGPKTAQPDPIREHEVVRSAPDRQSAEAARKIAVASKWLVLGFDQGRNWLWGEYEGRDHYYVFSALRGSARGCDCGSAKDPCKHVLALRLLAARQHAFADRAVPEALVRNASRERPSYSRSDGEWDWYPSDD